MNFDWTKLWQVVQTIMAIISQMQQKTGSDQQPNQQPGQQAAHQQDVQALVQQHGGQLSQPQQQALKTLLESTRR